MALRVGKVAPQHCPGGQGDTGRLGKAGIPCGISERNFPVLWLYKCCDSRDVGWRCSWREKHTGDKEPKKGTGHSGKAAAAGICPI